MLQGMRQASKSWIAWVLIGFLIVSFAIWGINDVFTGRVDTAAATVGDTEISLTQFDEEFKRELDRINRDREDRITAALAYQQGLGSQVLQRLMMQTALEKKGDELGVTVTAAQVQSEIRKMEGFQGPGGEFSPVLFQQALRQNNLSEGAFLALARGEMKRDQLMSSVAAGIKAPDGLLRAIFSWRAERRTVDYITLTPELAGAIPEPDQAALEAFLTANAPKYSVPESRAVTLVTIGAADVAGDIQITDAEIRELYEANRRAFETPERRKAEQIRFDTREAAEAAKQKIAGGSDFLAVAQEQGLSADAVSLGDVTKENLPQPIADAAFALAAGAVSEPVEGPFGWVLVRVTEITPGTSKTFEEAAAEIRQELVKERAADKIYALSQRFEDLRAEGRSLEDAAQELKITLQKIPALRRDGSAADGSAPVLPQAAPFLADVFDADPGADSDLAETRDDTFYAFRVDGVTPERLPTLDELRSRLIADWKGEQVRVRLSQRAEDLAIAANNGRTFEDIARELGRAPLRSPALMRGQPSQDFSPDLSARMFDAAAGAFVAGPAGSGESYVVARIAEILPPATEDPQLAAARAGFLDQLNQQYGQDLLQQFIVALETGYGNTVNQTALDRTFGAAEQP